MPFVIAIFLFLFIVSPIGATENGWILTQHSKVFGDQYVYLSAEGVKCVNPRQGIGWVAESPRWNITFFNDKTKMYYPLSYQQWKNKIKGQGLVFSGANWSKVGNGIIAGMKASQYKVNNSQSSQTSKWHSASYWLADEIKVPGRLSELISSSCQLPASNSIPLQLTYDDKENKSVVLLQTYRQQRAAIPTKTFYLPAIYKPAKSEVEVLISQENRDLLNELADDLKTKKSANITGQSRERGISLDKIPAQVSLPNGKTITKDQINKFLNGLK